MNKQLFYKGSRTLYSKVLLVLLCWFSLLPLSISTASNNYPFEAIIEYTAGPTERTYDLIEPENKKAMSIIFAEALSYVENSVKADNLQYTSAEIKTLTSEVFDAGSPRQGILYGLDDGSIVFGTRANGGIYIPRLYMSMGKFAIKRNAYDCAIKNFTKAIEMDPTRFEYYTTRGIAYQHQGEINLALADYDKAITINPKEAIDAAKNKDFLVEKLGQSQ